MTVEQPITSWIQAIPLMQDGYHQTLLDKVAELRQHKTIYPPQAQILSALQLTSFTASKVVILGQDPYHGVGQAHGLSFSVLEGGKIPPSLRNVFKEISQDIYHGEGPTIGPTFWLTFSTDLIRWATQGVLLLNSALTVEAKHAGSHKNLGWHKLTDEVVAQLSQQREHVVFVLWGAHAQTKTVLIDESKHLILKAPHPSPLSAYRGFFGISYLDRKSTRLNSSHEARSRMPSSA